MMKKEIERLEQLIKDYELIIEIHTSNEKLSGSKDYVDYIDSILDEINEIKKQIEKLKG